jgi:hypothetical protein
MRNTLVAAVLAVLFIAAMFALPRFLPSAPNRIAPSVAAAGIEPGFTGVQRIGLWTLVCAPKAPKSVPLPFSFGPRKPAAPAAGAAALGRCRALIVYRRKDDPKRAAMAVTFRLIGPQQKLAMVVRMPPIAKKGDVATLRLARGVVNLPVSACDAQICVAMGAFAPRTEAGLLVQSEGELALPLSPEGKRVVVAVPLRALRAVVDAMRRAQTGD